MSTNPGTPPTTTQPPADLILVNEQDEILGYSEKLAAHQGQGQLHRAFSVLIFNAQQQMLLQLRAAQKYHFGNLWSNACCGHPTRGVATQAAAEQRLMEEFGFRVPLTERFCFIYRAQDKLSGLSEHELDRVFIGSFEGTPQPNAEEIDALRWVAVDELLADVRRQPERYTPWFRILLQDPRAWQA